MLSFFPPQNGITGLYDNCMCFDVNMYGRIVPSKPCFGDILQILICCDFKVNFCYGQILCEASSFKFIGTLKKLVFFRVVSGL